MFSGEAITVTWPIVGNAITLTVSESGPWLPRP
jgi:hypothetical protein